MIPEASYKRRLFNVNAFKSWNYVCYITQFEHYFYLNMQNA